MKNLIIIILTFIGVSFLTSCEKEMKDPKLDMSQTVKPALNNPASGSSFVLTQAGADSIFTEFSWTAAVYNLDNVTSTNYILQMDNADNNFVGADNLVNTTETSFSITVGQMNDKLVSMGLSADTAHNIELRILAYINTKSEYSNIYSDVITLAVTPYEAVVGFPSLYVPGDYQGWNPATAPKIYDFDNDGVYNGYIYFPEGGTFEFKFTSDPDTLHTNYGTGGAGLLSTDPGAGNLTVPAAGGYALVVDVNTLTWSATLQNWGVIGEWLTWLSDINLEWNITTQELSVTVENIPAAANQRFKYRANDAWDINLGAKVPDDGTLVQGGADIPIPDGGTITFYLSFITPEPTYRIQVK